jgi:hypothetical protein
VGGGERRAGGKEYGVDDTRRRATSLRGKSHKSVGEGHEEQRLFNLAPDNPFPSLITNLILFHLLAFSSFGFSPEPCANYRPS